MKAHSYSHPRSVSAGWRTNDPCELCGNTARHSIHKAAIFPALLANYRANRRSMFADDALQVARLQVAAREAYVEYVNTRTNTALDALIEAETAEHWTAEHRRASYAHAQRTKWVR